MLCLTCHCILICLYTFATGTFGEQPLVDMNGNTLKPDILNRKSSRFGKEAQHPDNNDVLSSNVDIKWWQKILHDREEKEKLVMKNNKHRSDRKDDSQDLVHKNSAVYKNRKNVKAHSVEKRIKSEIQTTSKPGNPENVGTPHTNTEDCLDQECYSNYCIYVILCASSLYYYFTAITF